MPTTIFAKRYAQAAFQIAQEKSELEEWRPALRKIAELTRAPEFIALVENPKLSFDLKTKLTKENLGEIDPLVLNLAYLLIAKGRIKNIGQIADEYERLLDDYYGIKHADVVTATPIEDKDKEKLVAQLEAIVGTKVIIDLHVDPQLIGGIVTRIDGRLIDGSIRNKLDLLRKELAETRK